MNAFFAEGRVVGLCWANQNLKDLKKKGILKDLKWSTGNDDVGLIQSAKAPKDTFLRKGVSLGYVGPMENLKDLKAAQSVPRSITDSRHKGGGVPRP